MHTHVVSFLKDRTSGSKALLDATAEAFDALDQAHIKHVGPVHLNSGL